MSRNSHPSGTANTAIHFLKWEHILLTLRAMAQRHNGVLRNYSLLRPYSASLEYLMLTGIDSLIRELTRSDSFFVSKPWHLSEILVCLHCWQIGKESRLPWYCFVSVQIYYKYRLSIIRKNSLAKLKIFHSAVVRTPTFRVRGREFDSALWIFFRIKLFFYFFIFPFFSIWKLVYNVRIYTEPQKKRYIVYI